MQSNNRSSGGGITVSAPTAEDDAEYEAGEKSKSTFSAAQILSVLVIECSPVVLLSLVSLSYSNSWRFLFTYIIFTVWVQVSYIVVLFVPMKSFKIDAANDTVYLSCAVSGMYLACRIIFGAVQTLSSYLNSYWYTLGKFVLKFEH